MRSLSVSRNTVRRALKLLESEQIVESVPGVGWRIPSSNDRRSLAERMAALIIESSLGLGDTYPSESKLCERFGASRTAVRRALAHLEGIGLLHTVHGKGRTVRALPGPPEYP
jgi:DNA-binding GntR family transcriptional regulator